MLAYGMFRISQYRLAKRQHALCPSHLLPTPISTDDHSDPEIHPTTVSGTWYPAAPAKSISLGDTVRECGGILLHFHGGGYVVGSGQPLDSGHMANILTRHVTPIALFAEYRLSCTPDGRFPAALQDGLSAYLFLLEQDVQPQHIVLSGDSAGGHLVISLLRYINEFLASEKGAPSIQYEPSCALLWSPWIDVAGAASASNITLRPQYGTDYLPAAFAEWAVAAFAPVGVVNRDSEYVTLLHKPFKTKARLWIHVGAVELLYDEVIEWAEEMRAIGCDVCLRVAEHAYHDVVESSYINGFKLESKEAVM